MSTPVVTVVRDERSKAQCMGVCYVEIDGEFVFKSESIERGDNDNRARISCIPAGTYPIELEYSNRFDKELWEIKSVYGRSECKFHAANYSRQLNGCIALGANRKDIDSDGLKDVTSSRLTMGKFHKALEGYTKAILNVIEL